MANFIGEVYGQFGSIWKKLSGGQKFAIILVGVATAAGITGLLYWSSLIEMGVLYSKMEQSDAGEIQVKLDEWGIPYELRGEGLICIPRDRVLEIRNRLSMEGLPRGDGVGMEIFDTLQLGMTEFLQNVNLNRARETELKRTIAWLDPVVSCRVHLVEPKPTIFTELEQAPTAAVILRLKPGSTLSTREVMGIANIVAAAVEGLRPENVKVIDSKGRMLSRPPEEADSQLASGQFEIKQSYEKALTRKVQERLDGVVGSNKVSVLLNVELDFQTESKKEKKFSYPDGEKLVIKERTNTEDMTRTSARTGDGATGTESKLSGESGGQSPEEETNTKEDIEREFAVNEVESNITEGGVTVKRLTLAIMIDESLQAQQAMIEGIVKQAVGFDLTRNDTFETAIIAFSVPEVVDESEALADYEQQEFILTLVKHVIQGLAVAGVILVLFMVFRKTEKRVKSAARDRPEAIRGLSEERERVEQKRSREEVLTAVQADPVMASEILYEWLNEEES